MSEKNPYPASVEDVLDTLQWFVEKGYSPETASLLTVATEIHRVVTELDNLSMVNDYLNDITSILKAL